MIYTISRKYTSSQIRQMTWAEWNNAMAKELNENGYRARGFNPETRRWESNRELYKADFSNPKVFIFGTVDGAEEYECLKRAGLLNNGRCPMCGDPIYGNPDRFTSGYDYNAYFQICQNCCNKGRHSSLNPANRSRCVLSLISANAQYYTCTTTNSTSSSGSYGVNTNSTSVNGHYRSSRNGTHHDNYSVTGNSNPYTGQSGRVAKVLFNRSLQLRKRQDYPHLISRRPILHQQQG